MKASISEFHHPLSLSLYCALHLEIEIENDFQEPLEITKTKAIIKRLKIKASLKVLLGSCFYPRQSVLFKLKNNKATVQ